MLVDGVMGFLSTLGLFGGIAAVVALVLWIDAHARRGERIYRARHRDHSKVPPIK
ncbi:Trk-type K+ transport system membrane component [Variovorax sp. TBS-050B]|uniref:hypothetical protein n=1 Tax=Variovorax sp. TBS-050B TaxID=2940551 RepID=UPI002473B3B3|nr:hypothetical protein [Variovorax sp. TBS-050B]MDH6594345.1 Trk-type K+ transport system membrane component [Variovorax sp. TBS-050B]